MIHEYLILLSYFILSLIVFFIAKASTLCKEQIYIDNIDKEKTLPIEINIYNNYLFYLIYTLLLCRLLVVIIIPQEIDSLHHYSTGFVNYFITIFLSFTFWFMFLFFLHFRKSIKERNLQSYLLKIYKWGGLLSVADIIGTTALYFINYKRLFKIPVNNIPNQILETYDIKNQLLFLIAVTITLIIYLFIRFMLKRSIRFIRNYWISVLVLFILLVIFFLKVSTLKIGWYDSVNIRFKLFTWEYTYLAWIFLLFVMLSMFYNLSAMIVLSFKNILYNPQQAKQVAIHLIKMGFVSVLIVSVLFIYSGL